MFSPTVYLKSWNCWLSLDSKTTRLDLRKNRSLGSNEFFYGHGFVTQLRLWHGYVMMQLGWGTWRRCLWFHTGHEQRPPGWKSCVCTNCPSQCGRRHSLYYLHILSGIIGSWLVWTCGSKRSLHAFCINQQWWEGHEPDSQLFLNYNSVSQFRFGIFFRWEMNLSDLEYVMNLSN